LKKLAKIVNFTIFRDKITIEQLNNLLLEFEEKCVILLFLEFRSLSSYAINLLEQITYNNNNQLYIFELT